MFGLALCNPNKEQDKTERQDMSSLGVEYVQPEPLETGLGAGYV
jgi:hypothetical protein